MFASSMTPPTSCPAIAPIPLTAPCQAVARPRWAAGKRAVTRDSTWGTIAAAARPCARRPMTSRAGDCARPHSSEANVKDAMPVTKIRR